MTVLGYLLITLNAAGLVKNVLPERLNKFLPSVDSTSDFHMSLPVLDFKSEGI